MLSNRLLRTRTTSLPGSVYPVMADGPRPTAGRAKYLARRQRCADPEIFGPRLSADVDQRSASASVSAGRCCLGSAVSPRVRRSLTEY